MWAAQRAREAAQRHKRAQAGSSRERALQQDDSRSGPTQGKAQGQRRRVLSAALMPPPLARHARCRRRRLVPVPRSVACSPSLFIALCRTLDSHIRLQRVHARTQGAPGPPSAAARVGSCRGDSSPRLPAAPRPLPQRPRAACDSPRSSWPSPPGHQEGATPPIVDRRPTAAVLLPSAARRPANDIIRRVVRQPLRGLPGRAIPWPAARRVQQQGLCQEGCACSCSSDGGGGRAPWCSTAVALCISCVSTSPRPLPAPTFTACRRGSLGRRRAPPVGRAGRPRPHPPLPLVCLPALDVLPHGQGARPAAHGGRRAGLVRRPPPGLLRSVRAARGLAARHAAGIQPHQRGACVLAS